MKTMYYAKRKTGLGVEPREGSYPGEDRSGYTGTGPSTPEVARGPTSVLFMPRPELVSQGIIAPVWSVPGAIPQKDDVPDKTIKDPAEKVKEDIEAWWRAHGANEDALKKLVQRTADVEKRIEKAHELSAKQEEANFLAGKARAKAEVEWTNRQEQIRQAKTKNWLNAYYREAGLSPKAREDIVASRMKEAEDYRRSQDTLRLDEQERIRKIAGPENIFEAITKPIRVAAIAIAQANPEAARAMAEGINGLAGNHLNTSKLTQQKDSRSDQKGQKKKIIPQSWEPPVDREVE